MSGKGGDIKKGAYSIILDREDKNKAKLHNKFEFTLGLDNLWKIIKGYRIGLSICFDLEMVEPSKDKPWGNTKVVGYWKEIVFYKSDKPAKETKESVLTEKNLHKSGGTLYEHENGINPSRN